MTPRPLDYYNHNSLINFPLAEDANTTSQLGVMLPKNLLVDAVYCALTPSVALVSVEVTSALQLVVTLDDGSSASFDLSTYTTYTPVRWLTPHGGDRGHLIGGAGLADIVALLGTARHTFAACPLATGTVLVVPPAVFSLGIPGQLPLTGAIQLVGNNIKTSTVGQEVVISAIYDYDDCEPTVVNFLKSLNGATPLANGNLTVAGYRLLTVTPGVASVVIDSVVAADQLCVTRFEDGLTGEDGGGGGEGPAGRQGACAVGWTVCCECEQCNTVEGVGVCLTCERCNVCEVCNTTEGSLVCSNLEPDPPICSPCDIEICSHLEPPAVCTMGPWLGSNLLTAGSADTAPRRAWTSIGVDKLLAVYRDNLGSGDGQQGYYRVFNYATETWGVANLIFNLLGTSGARPACDVVGITNLNASNEAMVLAKYTDPGHVNLTHDTIAVNMYNTATGFIPGAANFSIDTANTYDTTAYGIAGTDTYQVVVFSQFISGTGVNGLQTILWARACIGGSWSTLYRLHDVQVFSNAGRYWSEITSAKIVSCGSACVLIYNYNNASGAVVLGPTTYHLVWRVFDGVTWSSSSTLQSSRERILPNDVTLAGGKGNAFIFSYVTQDQATLQSKYYFGVYILGVSLVKIQFTDATDSGISGSEHFRATDINDNNVGIAVYWSSGTCKYRFYRNGVWETAGTLSSVVTGIPAGSQLAVSIDNKDTVVLSFHVETSPKTVYSIRCTAGIWDSVAVPVGIANSIITTIVSNVERDNCFLALNALAITTPNYQHYVNVIKPD